MLQCRPGHKVACTKAPGLVAAFLTERYLYRFRRCQISPTLNSVEMVSTREIFKLKASFYNLKPLKIAARLSMEDLSISMLNSEEKHILLKYFRETFSHRREDC